MASGSPESEAARRREHDFFESNLRSAGVSIFVLLVANDFLADQRLADVEVACEYLKNIQNVSPPVGRCEIDPGETDASDVNAEIRLMHSIVLLGCHVMSRSPVPAQQTERFELLDWLKIRAEQAPVLEPLWLLASLLKSALQGNQNGVLVSEALGAVSSCNNQCFCPGLLVDTKGNVSAESLAVHLQRMSPSSPKLYTTTLVQRAIEQLHSPGISYDENLQRLSVKWLKSPRSDSTLNFENAPYVWNPQTELGARLHDVAWMLDEVNKTAQNLGYTLVDRWATGAIHQKFATGVGIEFVALDFLGAIPVKWQIRMFTSDDRSHTRFVQQCLASMRLPGTASWTPKTVRRDDEHEIKQALQSAMDDKRLTDLHTHLTGMGSREFWVEQVMEKLLPDVLRNAAPQAMLSEQTIGKLKEYILDPSPALDFATIAEKHCSDRLKQQLRGTKSDHWEQFFSARLTNDVVYSREVLLTGPYGYDPTNVVAECRTAIHPENALWLLEQKICNPHVAPTFSQAALHRVQSRQSKV